MQGVGPCQLTYWVLQDAADRLGGCWDWRCNVRVGFTLLVENIQVGEKAAQNYRIETVNAGGHSSIPIRDNAIYELADALAKIRDHEFAVKLTDTTRAYFAKAGAARNDSRPPVSS